MVSVPDTLIRVCGKEFQIVSMTAWRKWLASRMGTFTLNNMIHVLCVACGIPVAVSDGEKTYRGVHGNVVMESGNLVRVVVGALVKWNEVETEVWGMDNSQTETSIEIEEKKVYAIVTHKGIGCLNCQMTYLKMVGNAKKDYEIAVNRYTVKKTQLDQEIRAYALSTLHPDPAILNMGSNMDSPKWRVPYIRVNVKVIDPEKTVAYYRQEKASKAPSIYQAKVKPVEEKTIADIQAKIQRTLQHVRSHPEIQFSLTRLSLVGSSRLENRILGDLVKEFPQNTELPRSVIEALCQAYPLVRVPKLLTA